MALNVKHPFVEWMIGYVQHYHRDSYWKMREKVITYNPKGSFIIDKIKMGWNLWRLYRIKRIDAFNNASLGTNIGFGAHFDEIPSFPHGLYGIIITPYACLGKNVRIFHQVTIGDDGRNKYNAPIIHDNVILYPGCKILGKCVIGEGAKIGANAVVSFDVPPHTVVTAPKPIMKVSE